ncbi:MAG TPA: c-type cytochrome [Nitrospiria bacterium]|jgi:mono/diheme cytochrome c family protein
MKHLLSSGLIVALTLTFGLSISTAEEFDLSKTRVPVDQLVAAKALKNPFQPTPENIAKGKEIYLGKGTCFTCHGNEGKGDGPAGAALSPSPRNFTNPEFHTIRTEGEMFWVVKNGSPGTGMISYTPAIISEDEAWLAILFEGSLGVSK